MTILRRTLVIGTGVLAACGQRPAIAQNPSGTLARTANSGTGPFYPKRDIATADGDSDLVHLAATDPAARGRPVIIQGSVIDQQGRPVAAATVDLWQCDAQGVYRHPRAGNKPRDVAFQGFGRTHTAADGGFSFLALYPTPYPGRAAPHIHVRVQATGYPVLATEFYSDAEAERNVRDGIYRGVVRKSPGNVVSFRPGGDPGLLETKFVIVI